MSNITSPAHSGIPGAQKLITDFVIKTIQSPRNTNRTISDPPSPVAFDVTRPLYSFLDVVKIMESHTEHVSTATLVQPRYGPENKGTWWRPLVID